MPIYLNLDPIKGESKDPDHVGWLEVASFYFGAHAAAGGGNTFVSKYAINNDIQVICHWDRAVAELTQRARTGLPIGTVQLDSPTHGPHGPTYVRYEFTNAVVTNVVSGGNDKSGQPLVNVGLNFEKQEFKYLPDVAPGTLDKP